MPIRVIRIIRGYNPVAMPPKTLRLCASALKKFRAAHEPNLARFLEEALQATTPFVTAPRAVLRLPWAKVRPPLRGLGSTHSAK